MATYIKSQCADCENELQCDECIDVEDGSSISITNEIIGNCYHYITEYGHCDESVGVTFTNNTGTLLNVNVEGGVNDDVMFNGVVYEDGMYCFFRPDCGFPETPCTYVNGSHSFNYNQSLANGSSIIIKGIDNGLGGGIDCIIRISFA